MQPFRPRSSFPCAFIGTNTTVGHVRIVSPSPSWTLRGQTASFTLFWMGQNQIVMKMVSSLCEQKRPLIASAQLQNSQAAASFQHTQLLLLQFVTRLVNHPLFISKSYVKLCTIAFCPCTRKRETELLQNLGTQKQRRVWNPLLRR